jgi:hydroxymethylbilane synthase
MRLVIGTRGSALALWQATHIRARILADASLGVHEVDLEVIKTQGDRILDVTLSKVGGKGLFVKEIEEALSDGRIDLAVHSMKDVPAALPDGLWIGATPPRADARDAWVCRRDAPVTLPSELPTGAIVGTSSLRRASQLLARRPDLRVVSVRGNVDTRLRKLDEGEGGMEIIVLACAGLERLGLSARISHAFTPAELLPAVGQGALGIEVRVADDRLAPVLAALTDRDTWDRVTAERGFLRTIEGSCQVPVAAHATVEGEQLTIEGLVAREDGREVIRRRVSGPRIEADALGTGLARDVLLAGGDGIMAALTTGR